MEPDQAKFLLDGYLPMMQQEWEITRKVIRAIPKDHQEYRPDPKARTAPELAWHIAATEVWFLEGLVRGEFPMAEPERPAGLNTMNGIVEWYEKTAPPLIERIRALPLEKLAAPISFFGLFNYPAVQYFNFLIMHTVHHRGQLSTYLRPMGGKIPSIYGGSADEPFEMPK